MFIKKEDTIVFGVCVKEVINTVNKINVQDCTLSQLLYRGATGIFNKHFYTFKSSKIQHLVSAIFPKM